MNILYVSILFNIMINIFTKHVVCIGLDEIDAEEFGYISSIAVHKSRAFLALPRSVCFNKISDPTLIETYWDEGYQYIFSRFLQKVTKPKIISSQTWGDCFSIQDAIYLSMEPLIPKLWILDRGNYDCSPKILSYHTIFNLISDKTELTTIRGRNLNSMVIDPIFEKNFGHRAYIGQTDENFLIVFCLKTLIWWKVHLTESSNPFMVVNTNFLEISKTSSNLFLTGNEREDIFSLNLEQLRHLPLVETEGDSLILNVTLLGQKLGASTGIVSDLDGGLIYFMKRFHAILRWNTEFPIVAEHHTVLAQSFQKFPYISGFFTDSDDDIWAIVNSGNPNDCNNVTKNLELKNRTVRIIKYSKSDEEITFDV
ncbi:uncharacterized protein LOC130443549 isoform X1 [Diorhabda sublineata]|uniref:uncharacterized protein LOC130443549 isoform X1 n=1 Tax=Diorhabda sublineata TaxID=1163346 RepID=UPI0024E15D5C|nr:uncharacterized protein LOC130443549 isoform X1 [Diorhabda sublineata]